MLRVVAALVLLLGALSTLTSVSAFQAARPTNGMTVSVTAYDQAQISITPGSNSASLGWVQGANTGAVTLELTRGAGGAPGYTFDTNATYTAYRILRITNHSNAPKTVTVNHGSGNVTVISGYVGSNGTPTTGTTYVLPASGGYVELNLRIAAGVSGGIFTYTVIATN